MTEATSQSASSLHRDFNGKVEQQTARFTTKKTKIYHFSKKKVKMKTRADVFYYNTWLTVKTLFSHESCFSFTQSTERSREQS